MQEPVCNKAVVENLFDNKHKASSTSHGGYDISTNFKRKINSEAIGSNIYMQL